MYLAHYDREYNRKQTVYDHSKNVAELAADRSQSFPSLLKLTGLLHDMGKCKDDFQNYLLGNNRAMRGTIDHSTAGAKFLYDKYYTKGEMSVCITVQVASLIICSHHNYLLDFLDLGGNSPFLDRMNKEKFAYEESMKNFLDVCCKENEIDILFNNAVEEITEFLNKLSTNKILEESFFYLFLIIRNCFSCLIDADCYETACFMDNKAIQLKTDKNDFWKNCTENLESYIKENLNKTDSTLNKIRSRISEDCKNSAKEKKGVYRLCVPTGAGKTISSLRYALHHACIQKDIQHIFYVIPYLSILRQNSKTIEDILQCDDEILKHFTDYIEDIEEEEIDMYQKRKLISERWNAPIIMTSMVQFLNTLFLGKKANARRMHQISNSILIFDEIQTLPIKTTYMFNSAINFLVEECNCTVLLCSATLPKLNNVEVPLRISSSSLVRDKDLDSKLKRTNIEFQLKMGGYSNTETVEFIENKMKSHENALIILNTKNVVINVYEKLLKLNEDRHEKNKYNLYCLTTNMCLEHRNLTLAEIERKLMNNEKVICVSTNLIEAGIDIDFQMVIKDLSGLDSIIQAAGRCNRNASQKLGFVYVIKNNESNISRMETVKYGVDATIELLQHIKDHDIKDDITSSRIIEKYYEIYYEKFTNEMAYPIKKYNNNLYDMLSLNKKCGHACDLLMRQAFETAGREFRVIDEDTYNVIVPYRQGKNIIEELKILDKKIDEISRSLRKAQLFSVSIRKSSIKMYACEFIEDLGIYVLDEGCYDEMIGLKEKEFDAICV